MTPQEIRDRAASVVPSAVVEQGKILFCEYFSVDEGEEVHDVSWEEACNLQENLACIGLKAVWESDNDSVFGEIVELTR